MALDEDRQAKAIATEWGVDPDLLDQADWEIESIDTNDGFAAGYFVRFDEETDRELLHQLGVRSGEFYRELSINAFDQLDFELIEPAERQNDGRRAYFIDEERFTPSQFRKLSKRRKVQAMVQWFHENYEDPAVRMPYESAEGGYQWIWGGPYDAGEQIGDEFSDISDQASIDKAAAEITGDGLFDWAPKARREDYAQDEDWNLPGEDEDWNQPGSGDDYTRTVIRRTDPTPEGEAYLTDGAGRFLTDEQGRRLLVGGPISRSAASNFSNFRFAESVLSGAGSSGVPRDYHQEVLSRIESLEASLQTYRENLPPRSHNHPPELVEPDPISPIEIRLVGRVTIEIRNEVDQPQPDPVKLEEQASKLKAVAGSILAWLGRKADTAIDSAIKWAVPTLGAAWLLAGPDKVYANLLALAETVSAWAQHLASGI
ncbi:hypothetical protein [Rhizobium ruizarguesonis]|uniref:hypothetical protein n=1 Tax=Rhizobium ruizarguesonis TaxID=2081791 RepID=UPI00102F90C8|nr:hypothetical protein [Rhizobium ruizarguesonis]TBE02333.1 hypothetical protein ELH10_15685 [Rhizobium ruizarguesonis]TBF14710.1 hypothetical protein ELG95_14835 [Rhizobium ruizarguesonis]